MADKNYKKDKEKERLTSNSPVFSKGSTQRPKEARNKMKEGSTNDDNGNQASTGGYRKPGQDKD